MPCDNFLPIFLRPSHNIMPLISNVKMSDHVRAFSLQNIMIFLTMLPTFLLYFLVIDYCNVALQCHHIYLILILFFDT